MKRYGRQLYTGVASAVIGTLMALGGHAAFGQVKTDALPITCYSDSAISRVKDFGSFDTLKVRIPALSRDIARMRAVGDSAGLWRAYDSTCSSVLSATELSTLGEAFDRARTRDEKLAVLFLALPFLADRAVRIPFDSSGPEVVRAALETQFLARLLRTAGFADIHAHIRQFWYKDDGWPPRTGDKQRFFSYFATL